MEVLHLPGRCRGLTAQRMVLLRISPLWHSPQRRQGVMSSTLPRMIFRGRKGSAIRARPMAMQSTPLSSRKASILSGSLKAPTVTTGVLDVLLDLSGKTGVFAVLLEGAGVHQHGGILVLLTSGGDVDQIHLAVQGPWRSQCRWRCRSPPGIRSEPEMRMSMGKAFAHGGRTFSTTSSGKRIRFSMLPPTGRCGGW